MEIVVCVHEIDETSSPGAGGMWRWAVHVGRDFSDADSCLNAGAAGDRLSAEMFGQAVAVAAAKVAQRCGRLKLTDDATTVVLDHDPCGRPWPILTVEDY
jgi:hypothetical protein